MLEVRDVPDVRRDRLEEAQRTAVAEHDERIERTEALIEYTAMMADVELPEEDDE